MTSLLAPASLAASFVPFHSHHAPSAAAVAIACFTHNPYHPVVADPPQWVFPSAFRSFGVRPSPIGTTADDGHSPELEGPVSPVAPSPSSLATPSARPHPKRFDWQLSSASSSCGVSSGSSPITTPSPLEGHTEGYGAPVPPPPQLTADLTGALASRRAASENPWGQKRSRNVVPVLPVDDDTLFTPLPPAAWPTSPPPQQRRAPRDGPEHAATMLRPPIDEGQTLYIHRVGFRYRNRLMVFTEELSVDTAVIVTGDRGLDLGRILPLGGSGVTSEALAKDLAADPNAWIRRLATEDEATVVLPELRQYETEVLAYLRELSDEQAGTQLSKMEILDVEAQLDRKKLTVYYREACQYQSGRQSTDGVRFAPLAVVLFRRYPSRIWFERVAVDRDDRRQHAKAVSSPSKDHGQGPSARRAQPADPLKRSGWSR